MPQLVTTLKDIRENSPCHDGWTKLLDHLGKTKADEEPVDLLTVLDSNGLDDALWVLDNVIRNKRIISLFSADCAERVLPLFTAVMPDDDRPAAAIRVARDPDATDADRAAAGAAARAAARDAAWAAGAAARAAAGAAQSARLRQYLIHGEAAANMPWPDA